MKKNNNGVTMVTLVIVIVIMLIVSGIIVYEGTNAIIKAKQQSVVTNMLLIQAKTKIIQDKKQFGEVTEYTGTIASDELKNKLNISGDNIYILSQDNLSVDMALDMVGDNIFVVDYEKNEIYYTKGIKGKNGENYYSLTDIQKNVFDEDNEESKDKIEDSAKDEEKKDDVDDEI